MERLTFDGLFCDIAMCKETPGGTFCEDGACSQRKVWERLKEYEDTGLEPEEIVGLQKQNDLLAQYGAQKFSSSMEDFKEINSLKLKIQSLEMSLSVACDGLNKYTQAEQEGRLVVLPCEVGDTAWVKDRAGVPREMRLETADIRFVCTDEDNLCMATCHRRPDGFCAYRIKNDGTDIGKAVFLTREEAERALEGGNGDAG